MNLSNIVVPTAVISVILLSGCQQPVAQVTPTPQPEIKTATPTITPSSTTTTSEVKVAPTASVLTMAGLNFTLPKDWVLQKIEKESMAKIKVPDAKYNVVVPMQVTKSKHVIAKDDKLLKTTAAGAKIYDNACAPGIACYYLVYGGSTYDVAFDEVASNQQPPANLDGVWFPDTTVTTKDTLDFVASVK